MSVPTASPGIVVGSPGAPAGPLAGASVGVNQILWANDDLPDLTPAVDALVILDEIRRLGYAGSQLGTTFPRGTALRDALLARGLRISEVYATLGCDREGPLPSAAEAGRARLAELHAAEGDVLVAALELTPDRIELGGRATADGVPRMSDAGFARLAGLLESLGREATALGHQLTFHNHVGTYVETPDELHRLMAVSDADLVGCCLDVGHYLLGGGDPVAALRSYGERVRHVHLKDVDPRVMARMRTGELAGFLEGLRGRVFTEVGAGSLDLAGVLGVLTERDYRGWIVVEQDTTWRPPSESAAISRAVLDYGLRELARGLQ